MYHLQAVNTYSKPTVAKWILFYDFYFQQNFQGYILYEITMGINFKIVQEKRH